MAGLIKNQILKHLSKFTKNLSPDKIKVSTLKGEGDLSNLELDEKVLTELLDLPTWLTLSKAVCNRVAIKIQWTKLKTQPICVFLDEIEVEMETCENIRNPSAQSPLADLSSSGKYGLAERIVDGMYVSINSVVVNFKAKAFHASIQLSRIIIQSKTPIWDRSGDLRTTRIKDEIRGEMLLFKEAEWQTLRIEANALDGSNLATTPLRLIANQSKIRITIKKRLMDCGIVASRLLINLDDLLWVLTDSQLKAAFAFINSLKDVIKKSAQQSKLLAADKIRKQGFTPSRQTQQTAHGKSNRAATKSEQAITKLFNKYDIGETSYHLHSGRIDLHLCEDPSSDEDVYRKKVEGGAIQMTFLKMCFDYYPFHPAGAERTHWLKYDENMAARDTWATELMQSFRDDVRKVRNAFSPSQQGSPTKEAASSSSQHSVPPPPSGGDKNMTGHQHHQQQTLHVNGVGPGSNPPPLRPTNLVRENHASPAHQGVTSAGSNHGNQPQQHKGSHQASFQAATKHTRLLENSFIFRLEDFVVFQVSSATDSRRRAPPRKFLSSEKKQLWLPQEMSSLHMEYTDYYFPEGIDFPGVVADGVPSLKDKEVHSNVQGALTDDYLACVPHANLYVVINPIKVTLDYLTLLWLNAFSLNISNSLNIPEQKGPTMHTDIRLDALMPRLIVPGEEQEYPEQIDRPTSLQLQLSRVVLTNCRLGNRCARTDLRELLDAYSNTKLLHKEEFPCCKKQLDGLPSCISNHANRADNAYFDKIVEDILLDRELPGSFSEQRLDELLVNSYSQRNSSPSNKGDNIHSGDKPTTGTSNTTVTHTLQQQQQQQLADQQCKKQSTDTNQSSHHHSSITSTGSSNTMNNSSSISSNNHGNSSIIGITNKANTTMTNTGESETRNGSSNSSNNKRKPLTNQDSVSSVGLTYYNMRTNSFKKDRRKDVWCAVIDQVWVEFLGAPSARGRPLPLVESFPLTLWMALPKASQEADREHGTTGRGTNADLGNQFKAKAVDGMTTGFTKKNHEQAAGAAMMADKDGQGMTDMDSGEGSSKTDQSVDKVTADLHVIAKVGGQVHLQISHYQYLFLMRTIETVTNFQNELQHDTQLILNEAPPPQKSVGLSVMLQEVELALVCLPNKDEFANDDSSVSNSSDLTQEEPATMTTEDTHQTPQRQSGQDSALGASFQSQKNGGLSKSHSDPELLSPTSSDEPQIDELVRLATSAMAASDTNLEMADRKTSVQSFMSRQTTTDSIAPGASLASISSLPSRENSSPAICISETGPSSQHYESPLGSSRGTPSDSPAHTARDPHQQHRRAGEVKKSLTTGISNLGNKFSNLGSKLKDKVNMNKRDFEMEEGEDWETVSVQSSDDEDYMMLKYQNEEELPAFDKQYGGVTEAGSDDNSQVIDIAKTTRGTVSVVTFKLYHVEAFVQLVDKDIKLATQVDHVIPEELGNIDLDKFQERFSAGTNTLSTDIPSPLPESPIQLSFSQGPQAEQLAPTAGDRGFLHCKVKGLHTRLPLAGLTSLTDLIEDEKHAPVIPLLAEITDSFITLQDSRSTTYATSVEKIPIDLHISKLAARRTEDGVFHLMGETLPSDLSLDAKYWKQKCIQTTPSIEHPPTARTINYVNLGLSGVPSLRKEQPQAVEESVVDGKNYKGLLDENEQLRRQLERIGKLSSQTGGIDAKSLESLQKECEHLKSKANKADRLQRENRALMEQLTRQVDDIFTMKEERESLLATIQMLQEELAESEQMRMAALKKTPK